jgi:hypothetical protein
MLISWWQLLFPGTYFTPKVLTSQNSSNKKFLQGGPDASRGQFFQKGGWHPQPIHGQPDAVLSELHLKSLPKKQSFTRY